MGSDMVMEDMVVREQAREQVNARDATLEVALIEAAR